MALRKDRMSSFPWSSSIAGTPGQCGGQPFSYTLMGYGNGPLYSPPPCLCCHKSIITYTCAGFEHSTSNRVLPCGHSTFCSIDAQGRGHNPSDGFNQECEGPPQIFRSSKQMDKLGRVPSVKTG